MNIYNVIILDESGSMSSIYKETLASMNEVLSGIKKNQEEFPEQHPVSEEESAIFDAAVGDYPMIHAKAEEVSSRVVPGGVEYLFTARDIPREGSPVPAGDAPARTMKVYVLAEDGQPPVFTQVVR